MNQDQAELKDRSFWYHSAHNEATKWSQTIIDELQNIGFLNKWYFHASETEQLKAFLAGEISRKRGAEYEHILNESKSSSSFLAKIASNLSTSLINAQDEVAKDFFNNGERTHAQFRQEILMPMAKEATVRIIRENAPSLSQEEAMTLLNNATPEINAGMERAIDKIDIDSDLRRLANLLSSTMMQKMYVKGSTAQFPKDKGWIIGVSTNFRFTAIRNLPAS